MAASAGDPWAYSPPLSLWQLVEQHVSLGEQDEIKSMLGTSLVETTLDLHNEVKMLLEIWQDYQEETKSENDKLLPIAEPPLVRERLVQEICFLAESIRDKSANKGMNPSILLSRHNSHILDYAEETQRSGSSMGSVRPMSARSGDGRETPLSSSEHAHSRYALDSTINKEVSTANAKLNYLQFDEVCNKLRDILTKEMEQLECDVAFLHGCLNDALDDRTHGGVPGLSREPTLTDLREERSLLEKDLLSTESVPATPHVNKPPFLPAAASSKMQTLGPINSKLRQSRAPSSSASSKNTPLKASHALPITSTESVPPDSSATTLDANLRPSSSHQTDTPKNVPADEKNPEDLDNKPERDMYRKDGVMKKYEVPGFHRRVRSPSRVKVVPVGSILEPRADSAGSRSFIPTPPPAEDMPRSSRPNSASRFRKMVMSHRDAT